jgi:hypothetical protein
MTKRLLIYGTLIAVLTLAWAAAHYCSTELSAVLWHIRHGSHAEIEGIRLTVPLTYEADDPGGLPSLSIMKLAGHLSGPGGIIMIDLRSRLSLEALEAADAPARQRGIKPEIDQVRLGDRPATFAGRRGKCVEYRTEVMQPRLQGFEIVCGFEGDVSVQFIGSSNLRDDVYNIIQTAEPAKRKN